MTYDDRDTVCQKGKFRLEEWEDVNYCEHCFYNDDEPLEDEEVVILLSDLTTENEQLKKENKRMTDKLNSLALEFLNGIVSMGKAVEISEMSYHDFLKYRKDNGNPMELQL